MTTQLRPGRAAPALPLLAEPGVRFGLANALLVVSLLVAALIRLPSTETAWLTVLTVGLAAVGLAPVASVSLGVIAWAMFTGFVENRFGELTFAEGDLERLVVFTAGTLAFALLAHRMPRRSDGGATRV